MLRDLQSHAAVTIHQAEITDRRLKAARAAGDEKLFRFIERGSEGLLTRAGFYDGAGVAEIDRGEKAALGFLIDRLNALFDGLTIEDGRAKYAPGVATMIDEAGTALRLLTLREGDDA